MQQHRCIPSALGKRSQTQNAPYWMNVEKTNYRDREQIRAAGEWGRGTRNFFNDGKGLYFDCGCSYTTMFVKTPNFILKRVNSAAYKQTFNKPHLKIKQNQDNFTKKTKTITYVKLVTNF